MSTPRVELIANVPPWASVGHPFEVGFLLVNRGASGTWVNTRLAVGHPASVPDVIVEIFDVHGRRMPSRTVVIEAPRKSDFVWLEPGQRSYGEVYDALRDHDLVPGKYTIELTWREPREVDDIPADLGEPVFRPAHEKFVSAFEIIQWGETPPKSRWKAT